MKKINHFTFDDIIRKRTLNAFNKRNAQNNSKKLRPSTQQQFDQESNENEVLMTLFEEFKVAKKNSPPVFTPELKATLVQFIAKKVGLKLNVSKMAPKIRIKKLQNIEIFDKPCTQMKRNQSSASISQSKKLQSSHNFLSRTNHTQKKYSYFVLSGNMHIYQKQLQKHTDNAKRKHFYEEQASNETMFFTWKQFESEYPEFKRTRTYSQFMGLGSVFAYKAQQSQQQSAKQQPPALSRTNTMGANVAKPTQMTIAEDCIYVQIQNPEYDDEYINHTGMEYEKMAQIIEGFSIFHALGKKIRNFTQFFEFKEYQRNQEVYKIGDLVNKFYLILKGQIVFEHHNSNPIRTPLMSPNQSRKNSLHLQMTIKTETVSSGNYFGEEEMIFEVRERLLTAKVKSSKVEVLEVSKEKFDKMLEYSDFYDCVKRGAQIKLKERLSKLQKNKEIRTKFALTQFNEQNSQQMPPTSTQRPLKNLQNITTPNFYSPKQPAKQSKDQKFRVMHGNVIRQFTQQQKQKMTENVHFSMLKVNPDMYEKTMDKFRKYSIKPREKYKPEINWELKRVWKVLNLENVLREQAQVASPEGRKFYDSHQRYMGHLKESKSLRPKTSSSTYRTKLQYIAYLQQFKTEGVN